MSVIVWAAFSKWNENKSAIVLHHIDEKNSNNGTICTRRKKTTINKQWNNLKVGMKFPSEWRHLYLFQKKEHNNERTEMFISNTTCFCVWYVLQKCSFFEWIIFVSYFVISSADTFNFSFGQRSQYDSSACSRLKYDLNMFFVYILNFLRPFNREHSFNRESVVAFNGREREHNLRQRIFMSSYCHLLFHFQPTEVRKSMKRVRFTQFSWL